MASSSNHVVAYKDGTPSERTQGRGRRELCVHGGLLPSSYMSGGHAARFEENEHGYEHQPQGKRGELRYADRFCNRLLRRPCTGWHQRVLRERCGRQVDRRNRVWVQCSAAPRRAQQVILLRLGCRTSGIDAFGPLFQLLTHDHCVRWTRVCELD